MDNGKNAQADPVRITAPRNTRVHFIGIETDKSEENGSNASSLQYVKKVDKGSSIEVTNESSQLHIHRATINCNGSHIPEQDVTNEAVGGTANSTQLNKENDDGILAAPATHSELQR